MQSVVAVDWRVWGYGVRPDDPKNVSYQQAIYIPRGSHMVLLDVDPLLGSAYVRVQCDNDSVLWVHREQLQFPVE